MVFTLSSVWAQERTVSGRVTSTEDGSSLPGVNVVIKGTTNGTVTDSDGNYKLNVPAGGGALVFSFIGLQTEEIVIGDRNVVDVSLSLDVTQLSEVVVVGYGTQERKEITGSVVSIASKDIENLVSASFDSQLAGRAPGVQVTTPGGIIGQRPIIRIRGVNSLTSSADPLIVIDGVPAVTDDRSSIVPSNPLANINPADIQSYEVLKDGSATAIYGSRAANGVILITTKRGTKGKATVNYSGSFGINQEVARFDLLSGDQFVEIANEKRTNAGLGVAANAGGNTDWQDHIFRNGAVQQHNVSLGGGSDNTNYFFSLGFTEQESPVIANSLKRYSFRANIDQKVANRVKLGTSLSYTYGEINGLNNGANSLSGAIYNASRMLPNVDIFDPANVAFDGYNVTANGAALGLGPNTVGVDNNIPNIAFVLANNIYRNRTNRLLANAYAEVEIVDGLSLRTQIGTDVTLADDFQSLDPRHGDGRGAVGSITQTFNPVYRWNWQNTLNYQKVFADVHNVNATIGVEYQKTNYYNFSASGTGFSDRFFLQQNLITGSYQNPSVGGGYADRGFESYFGRLNYSYKGKYLLSVSARNDAISDLYIDNRVGFFPGGSIGWRVSEEDFFNSTLITDLKVRASYAEVGNTEIGTLAYAGGFGAVLYGPNAGIALTQVSNRDLQWEVSKKINVGFNTTIAGITIEADYFKNDIDKMVLDAPVAESLGVPGNTIAQNVGAMTNSGFELRIASKVLERGDFKWTTDFNFTAIKNEVTSLLSPLTGSQIFNRTEVGRSIAELYGYRFAGVNPANGNPLYFRGDGSISQYNLVPGATGWRVYDAANPTNVATTTNALGANDLAFLGNTLPKWSGGLTNQFTFKNFDAEIFLRYSGGNYIMNETLRGQLGMGFSNNNSEILNRWTEAGQVTDVPKIYNGQDANIWATGAANSRFVEKGDFVRVQNIIIGYRVPTEALQTAFKGGIRSARVFAQVQNPFTFTAYKGLDPELNQFSNQLVYGVDWNGAPIIRTWTFGVNVGF
ncbi:TonB-dependent receptor [Chryseotalea sanaruensis]|uniref:TonB-dependent receptor n=2 Tax=Chryseotalea sanaruensis TaxID=2482724 RepID=A0A401UC91_9BACT|nr:TonB-dependent receptor [Chryseotalea sanaruensis]